jgi:hypothetical protein
VLPVHRMLTIMTQRKWGNLINTPSIIVPSLRNPLSTGAIPVATVPK